MTLPATETTTSISVKKTRLKRLIRAKPGEGPKNRLTSRDEDVIDAVYSYRALSTPQIVALFFPGADGAARRAQQRLQFLFHDGYLARIAPTLTVHEPPKPFIYMLDKKGADLA